MADDETAAYQRAHAAGVEAGVILERLKEHDRHFTRINGSIEKNAVSMDRMGQEISLLSANIERLSLQAISEGHTRIATAAALKDHEEARRQQSVSAWTPLTRVLAVVGAMVGVIGTIITFVIAIQGP